jgi:alkanesulfonate monooxygenase SsuD/methylene tetrahydromethanopterin reductase-like flavin-dependent oxidoreductase (luciferase family)
MPRRRVQPKPIQDPHPPIFGATASDSGHQMMGDLGLGLCSFSVAAPPEDTKRRIDIYRAAVEKCTTPLGATVNNQAAAFTMVNCAATSQASRDRSEESFGWYVKNSISLITTVADWMEEKNRKLDDTYSYLEPINQAMKSEALDPISNWDYLTGSKAVLAGTPDEVVETAKAYEEAGVDLLLCLVNPFKIGHEDVMETIELMGKHVIPEFAG